MKRILQYSEVTRQISILLVLLVLIVLNIHCEHIQIQRSDSSGYGPNAKKQKEYFLPPSANAQGAYNLNFGEQLNQKILNEMGLSPEALQDPELKKKYDMQVLIKGKEKYLTDERERKQYYNALPWFKNEDERIEFLYQPGYEARLTWMRKHKFGKRATEVEEDIAEMIDKKDITLGMSQDWVKKSWGAPDLVEVAGNPIYKNERWKYKKYVSSVEGYKLQKRIVYFEGGKVVGWEQLDE